MTSLPEREATEVRHDQAQIAMATLRLVGELGADRVTVAHVIKHLGISRAVMTRQCPTEGDLWRITAVFITQQMFQAWSASLRGKLSPAARLRSLLVAQIELIMDTPPLRDILFSRRLHQNHAALTRELSYARAQFQRVIAHTIEEGLAAGDFPSALNADKTAHDILEMLQGIVLSWSLAFEPEIAIEDLWGRLDALLGRSAEQSVAAAANDDALASRLGEE